MKKAQLNIIKIISDNLPNQSQASNINSVVSGEDAILAGTNEIDGKEGFGRKQALPGRRRRDIDSKVRKRC